MADIKAKLGTTNQAITVTLASLANAAMRQSAAIDNTTNLFLNALLTLKLKSGASGVSSTGFVAVWAYATTDDGTTYSGGAGAADAAYTGDKTNLKYLGRIDMTANATSYTGVFDIASAFGGVVPAKWGIVIENQSGAALDATEGNHTKTYQGHYAQSA